MPPADDKPKHKPNPKHTLEEILKSLQDLIRNDLLEGDSTPPTAVPTAAAAPIGPRRGPRAMDGAVADSPIGPRRGPRAMDGAVADSPIGPRRGPRAMDGAAADSPIGPRRGPRAMDGAVADSPGGELAALRHSLESLVTEELTTEDTGAAAPSAGDGSAPPAPGPDAAIPPEGVQDVFAFDAAAQAAAPEHAPSTMPSDQDDRQPESMDLASVTEGNETESSLAPQEPQAAAAQPAFDESPTADSEAVLATDTAPAAEDLTESTAQADVAPRAVPVEAPVDEMVEAADRLAAEPPPDTRPAETAGDWDDIPVLDEVVTETVAEHEPGELPGGAPLSLPAEAEGPKTGRPRPKTRVDSIVASAAPTPPDNLDLPLPAPSRAHDLAVRTVAKLNIELRKAGKRPLDAKVIARLAMMLRETLESDAAKVENRPHE